MKNENMYDHLSFEFTYDDYVNGGIYLSCSTEEGPYADISIWTMDTSSLGKGEFIIPLYKLSKEFLDKIEEYGFLKVDYDRKVQIGYGTGCIGMLADDYKEKIAAINEKAYKRYQLNHLASTFELAESRKQIIELMKDSVSSFAGKNADDEDIEIHVAENELMLKTYQENGAVRIDYYDGAGIHSGTTYDGRWK